jgi:DNA polymerase I-like protein with 3'-5' exonuclease and polymerase domains
VKLGIEYLATLQDAPWVAFDSETTGLQPTYGGLRLLQFAAPGCEPVVIDAWELHDDEWQPLQDFLAQDRTWVAHNAVFDLGWLQEYELIPQGRVVCTMLASRLLRNGIPNLRHGLAQVCEHYLKVEVDKTEQKSDWSQPTLTREQIAYAAKDVELLVRLWQVMEPLLAKAQLAQALSLECKALHAVAMMNRTGLPFDRAALVELERHYQGEIARLGEAFVCDLDQALPQDAKLPKLEDGSINLNARASGSVRLGTKVEAGFNLNSPKQLVGAFTQLLGATPLDPKTGKPSASRQALRNYAADHHVVQTYLGWKRAEKRRQMVQALLDHQDEDGFVRASYMQLGADTGRFSCRNPNLQQVPRDKGFRLAARAKPGYKFVVADFGQMELRLAAALSQDERMIQAFVDGEDLHTVTAQAIYQDPSDEEAVMKHRRQVAKACFSGDTEVLTPYGWVRFDEYAGQPVAQYSLPPGVTYAGPRKPPGPGYVSGRVGPWDGNWGEIEFVQPKAFKSFVSDDIWENEDRNTSVCATANHNILYIDAYGRAHLKPLSEVNTPRLFVGAGYMKRTKTLDHTLTRVLAMVVADGSFKQQRGYITLGFSKRRKIRKCEDLLTAAGITYKRNTHKNGDHVYTTQFKFPVSETPWIVDYVTPDKELRWAKCLEELDATVYLEEAQYWDGVVIEGQKRDRVLMSSVVKQAVDVMQAMAVTSGVPCSSYYEESDTYSTGAIHTVSYPFGIAPAWRVSWEPTQQPEQKVYCVQVPSGLLLIRRNGKVCVQGNCNFGLLYGSGAKGLRDYAGSMGITMTLEEAQKVRDTFLATYQGIAAWQQSNAKQAQVKQGKGWPEVRIPGSGLRRFLLGDMDRLTTRCNTPVQGAGAAILKLALANLFPQVWRVRNHVTIAAVVHDEVLLLVRENLAQEWCDRLSQVMCDAEAKWLGVIPPLADAAVGDTWAEAK